MLASVGGRTRNDVMCETKWKWSLGGPLVVLRALSDATPVALGRWGTYCTWSVHECSGAHFINSGDLEGNWRVSPVPGNKKRTSSMRLREKWTRIKTRARVRDFPWPPWRERWIISHTFRTAHRLPGIHWMLFYKNSWACHATAMGFIVPRRLWEPSSRIKKPHCRLGNDHRAHLQAWKSCGEVPLSHFITQIDTDARYRPNSASVKPSEMRKEKKRACS